MKKIAISILLLSLVFLTAPGLFAQPPVSRDMQLLYGGGTLTDDLDDFYFGFQTIDIKVYVNGEPKVEKTRGNLNIVSDEGPVLDCQVEDAVIDCGNVSILTCEDGTAVEVNDSKDTLFFNDVTYNLIDGIIECQSFAGP